MSWSLVHAACVRAYLQAQSVARGEDAELGEVLEATAASTLREISSHPPLVGLLLRRWGMYLGATNHGTQRDFFFMIFLLLLQRLYVF